MCVRVDGPGIVEDGQAARQPIDVPDDRYEQPGRSRPAGPVIIIQFDRWTGEAAGDHHAG